VQVWKGGVDGCDVEIVEEERKEARVRVGGKLAGQRLCVGCEGWFDVRRRDLQRRARVCMGCRGIKFGTEEKAMEAEEAVRASGLYPPLRAPRWSSASRHESPQDEDIAPDERPPVSTTPQNQPTTNSPPNIATGKQTTHEWNFPRSSGVHTTRPTQQHGVSDNEARRLLRGLLYEGQCSAKFMCWVCSGDGHHSVRCPELSGKNTVGGRMVQKILGDSESGSESDEMGWAGDVDGDGEDGGKR
jgi:hypothetical protein